MDMPGPGPQPVALDFRLTILYGLRPAPAMPGEQKFYPGNASQGSEEGSAAPGSFPTHHEVHLNCFGVVLRIDSRNALPSGQRGRITVPAKHFFSEILRLPGTGIAKMRPDSLGWPILGLCWPICCLCWGPCSPILRLCWGYVGPSWRHVGPCFAGEVGPSGTRRGDLGLCCFHDFTVSPKILLENALPSGLRGTHSIFATLFL